MLEKIAAVADYADKVGEYSLADELTAFTKQAGVLEGLWNLINPKNYGGDKDRKLLNRLQKSLLQGKLEKRLARSMSKLIEVGRIEQAIAQESSPLKAFIDETTGLYNSIFKPGASPAEIKSSLNGLNKTLRGAQRNFSGGRLAKLVEKREKLVHEALTTMNQAKLPEDMKKKLLEITGNPLALTQLTQEFDTEKAKVKEEKAEKETLPMDLNKFRKDDPEWAKKEKTPAVEKAKPAVDGKQSDEAFDQLSTALTREPAPANPFAKNKKEVSAPSPFPPAKDKPEVETAKNLARTLNEKEEKRKNRIEQMKALNEKPATPAAAPKKSKVPANLFGDEEAQADDGKTAFMSKRMERLEKLGKLK